MQIPKSLSQSEINTLRNVKVVSLPAGLEIIPHDSFAESQIEEITIPASVTEIQHDAFWGC